jgi:hypothetical protein
VYVYGPPTANRQVVEDAEALEVAGANDLPLAAEWQRRTGVRRVGRELPWAAEVAVEA